MKRIGSRVLGVLLLLAALDVIHDPADRLIPLAAAEITDDLQPLITTSELVVGENRFAFGLMKANKLLERAAVQLRIYAIDGPEARLTAETNALYQPIGSAGSAERVHRHLDGTTHVHRADSDVRGLYLTRVSFAVPGHWGIEIQAREDHGSLATARFTVTVLDAPQTPAPGSPAPRSLNLLQRETGGSSLWAAWQAYSVFFTSACIRNFSSG